MKGITPSFRNWPVRPKTNGYSKQGGRKGWLQRRRAERAAQKAVVS